MGYTVPPAIPKGIPGLQQVKHKNGRKRWVCKEGFIYEWDGQHAELEKYDRGGNHLGSFCPETGAKLKERVAGRKIEV